MKTLFEIKQLTKEYWLANGTNLKAVNHLSLTIENGETLGLIGESGSGKTTLMRCLMLLEKTTAGELFFDGKNILNSSPRELIGFKKQVQMVFQNSYGSLNPRMTIGENIAEPLLIHQVMSQSLIRNEVYRLLNLVGINSRAYSQYPFEFSGGQRQRVAIARALALKPRLLILDEPTSALDLSIQGQIINLLKELQKEYQLTYLFASHDLALVRYMADRVAVMHAGQIVELKETIQLFDHPQHLPARTH